MDDLLHWIVDEASRGLSEGKSIDALTAIKWKVIDQLHAPAQQTPDLPKVMLNDAFEAVTAIWGTEGLEQVAEHMQIANRARRSSDDQIRDELGAALATFNSNPSEQNKAALLNGLWTCREALVGGAELTSTDLCTGGQRS